MLEKGGELDEPRVEVAALDERVTSACFMNCGEVLQTPGHRQISFVRGRRVAIDDGDGLVALASANAEVLEKPVPLGLSRSP